MYIRSMKPRATVIVAGLFLAVFSFFYVQTEGAADDASGSIGKVYNLAGGVIITRADGTKVAISEGTAIFQDDVIETAADGKLGIVFNDDTTFSLGGDSRMVIDTMIYDAAANTGESDIDVLERKITRRAPRIPIYVPTVFQRSPTPNQPLPPSQEYE